LLYGKTRSMPWSLKFSHREAPVPVAVLVGVVEEVDLGEHHEEPVLAA
jgi:hypothetical protein